MDHLKQLPIWVAWRYQERDGKRTKVPFQTSGAFASSTNPSTWATFDQVSAYEDKDGIGIVFEPEARIVGVDFDHVIDPDTGRLRTNLPSFFTDFLNGSETYVEYSPSKTGLHALFQLEDDFDLISNKYHVPNDENGASIEVYTQGRYFTFTSDKLANAKNSPRPVSASVFENLLKILGYPWRKNQESTTESVTSADPSVSLSDDDLIFAMFNSKNGATVKALYEGDLSNYNNDHSTADAALLMHLAFWSQKNAEQMERLWLLSPLGQREKTQGREDYRKRSIANAIANTNETFTPKTTSTQAQKKATKSTDTTNYDFITRKTKQGDVFVPLVLPNIIRVVQNHKRFQNLFRRNTFSNMTEFVNPTTKKWEALNDYIIQDTRIFIAENFPAFLNLSTQMATDAILAVSHENQVNPPRDYLTSLVWDKTPRLNSWLHYAYGVPDDEVHQSIGSNWLKGLVKRVLRPGCQFDEALALESKQGWRKSTSLRVLGAPWHVETAHGIDNKDFYILLAQNVIVEFSEGEIFDRTSMKKLKAEITKTEDQFRPPYERGMVKFPRSCVFAVTTNDLELKDDTGNRRWLPVTLEKPADIDWLVENKDQLYAEAYYRVAVLNEATHEYPVEALAQKQAASSEQTAYDEKALEWYSGLSTYAKDEGVKLHDAITQILASDRIGKTDEMRMAGLFRRVLKLECRVIRKGGATVRRWFATDETNKLLEGFVPSGTPINPF